MGLINPAASPQRITLFVYVFSKGNMGRLAPLRLDILKDLGNRSIFLRSWIYASNTSVSLLRLSLEASAVSNSPIPMLIWLLLKPPRIVLP